MATTSKSPQRVVRAALATARRALPAYRHRFSPKVYTQHQLFACLVLKNFLKTDYRGVTAQLVDSPALRETLGLQKVPHFTTLHKASRRLLLAASTKKLLDATVRLHLGRKQRVRTAAVDSTGLECTAASAYFVKRRAHVSAPWKTMVYHRFPKLGVVCDTHDHFIFAMAAGHGPRPDVDEFRPLIADAQCRVRLSCVTADAGYDSEPNHRFAREEHNIRTVIPAKHGRPTSKPASGYYRRLMQVRFDRAAYRRRSQVETVMSMLKRRQGSHVRGHSHWSRCRALALLVLTHNIMLLVLLQVFDRASQSHF